MSVVVYSRIEGVKIVNDLVVGLASVLEGVFEVVAVCVDELISEI